LYKPQMIDDRMWCKGGMKLMVRKLKCCGKPVTVLLFPPSILHGPQWG